MSTFDIVDRSGPDLPMRLEPAGRYAPQGPEGQGLFLISSDGSSLEWSDTVPYRVEYRAADLSSLAGNMVHEWIAKVDSRLSPLLQQSTTVGATQFPTLRVLSNGSWHHVDHAPTSGRTLLFVHGTFSNSSRLMEDFKVGFDTWGKKSLGSFFDGYDHVLTFDYPTLSSSAVASGLQLANFFAGSVPQLDILSHSQGALVTRWFLEAFASSTIKQNTRVMFVGGTLSGTSLAAPPRLREAASYLTNLAQYVGATLGVASLAFPFLCAANGLIGVIKKVFGTVSKLPIIDVGVGLVPGLQGMSRVSTNAELVALQCATHPSALERYFAVTATYAPVGWKFWEGFSQRVAKFATDPIFPGNHDLVVDTESMYRLAEGIEIQGDRQRRHFEDNKVFHTNYFRCPEVVDFICHAFGKAE